MNRHEYEINQLINPKKDIVKSNSKHRDKIETLILGRRIGGMRGGEAPPEQTMLVATNYKSKKVMAGYVRNKVLYIYSGGNNTFNEYSTSGAYVGQVTDNGECNLFMSTLTDQDVQVNRWELVAQSEDDIDLSSYEMY